MQALKEEPDLDPLVRIAQELADRHGEPFLVVTTPDPKRQFGCGVPYAVQESLADAHERDPAHHQRIEPRKT